MHKGLTMHVYRAADWEREGVDCTAGGISSRFEQLTIIGALIGDEVRLLPREAQVFEPREDRPAVLLEVRRIGGYVLSVVPATIDEGGTVRKAEGWHMAGGNYAACIDSRFGDFTKTLTGDRFYGAVSIHDRKES